MSAIREKGPSPSTVLGVLILGALFAFMVLGPAAGLVAYAAGWDVDRAVAVGGAISWAVGGVLAFVAISTEGTP